MTQMSAEAEAATAFANAATTTAPTSLLAARIAGSGLPDRMKTPFVIGPVIASKAAFSRQKHTLHASSNMRVSAAQSMPISVSELHPKASIKHSINHSAGTKARDRNVNRNVKCDGLVAMAGARLYRGALP